MFPETKHKFRKLGKFFLILFMVLSVSMTAFVPSVTSYAADGTEGSWVKENSQNIYTDKDGKEKGQDITKKMKDQEEPGTLAGLLIGLIVDIGDWFSDLFSKLGISFNNIILGRVNGGGVMANGKRIGLYTYELSDGNPYGVVSMAVYNIIRRIMYILLACTVMARFVHAMYVGNLSKTKTAFKESAVGIILGFSLLTFMPYILDVALYIRDVILYTVVTEGNKLFSVGPSNVDVTKWFSSVAEKSFMNAFMYIASFVLLMYFAIQYIGMALCFVVNVIAFPFVCFNMQFDKNALQSWCKQVMSYALIPVVDCCLIMIPAFVGLIADTMPIKIVQFLVCTMLLPARAALKSAIGVTGNAGMDFAGYMTLMGAASLAKSAFGATVGSVVSGGRKFAGNMREASDSFEKASFHEDMANAEKGIMPDMEEQRVHNTMGQKIGSFAAGLRGTAGEGTERFTGQRNGFGKPFEKNSGSADMGGSFDGTTAGGPSGASGANGNEAYSDAYSPGSMDNGVPLTNPAYADENAAEEAGVSYENMSDRDAAMQAVLNKYADKDNFDKGGFSGLSNEKKAELYRERAKQKKRQAFTQGFGTAVGGMAGGFAGAVAGGTASMFLSPGATGMITGAAMRGGTHLGAGAVSSAGTKIADGAASAWESFSTRNNGKYTEQAPGPAPSGSQDYSYTQAGGETVQFNPAVTNTGYDENAYSSGVTGVAGLFYSETSQQQQPSTSYDYFGVRSDFVKNNESVAQSTLNNVCNFSANANSYNEVDAVYRKIQKQGGGYNEFRTEASEKLSTMYGKDFRKADYKSSGNSAVDAEMIAKSQTAVKEKLDPVDEKTGKQIPVQPNHPLSKENCACHGWTF